MNIHPLFVHFPIALLTTYAVLELVAFRRLTQKPYWFYLKAFLAIVGGIMSVITAITGKIAKNLFENAGVNNPIVLVHSLWATATVVIFCLLGLSYAIAWIQKDKSLPLYGSRTFAASFSYFFIATPVRFILAIVGLITVTITGALGAAIVYGPDLDPVVRFIYNFFF